MTPLLSRSRALCHQRAVRDVPMRPLLLPSCCPTGETAALYRPLHYLELTISLLDDGKQRFATDLREGLVQGRPVLALSRSYNTVYYGRSPDTRVTKEGRCQRVPHHWLTPVNREIREGVASQTVEEVRRWRVHCRLSAEDSVK